MDINPAEQNDIANEHDKSVAALASELHEEWRQSRLDKETGKYEPRVKPTKDVAWIASHDGATEVDIANTSYEDLPEDWQGENKASAEVAITEVERAKNSGAVELGGSDFLEKASDVVHQKWLERNGSWAPPEQNKPYSELSEEEKDKDRVMVQAAIRVVSGQNQ